MKILSVKYQIIFALVAIMLSWILTGIFMGLGPNQRRTALQERSRLCTAIALNASVFLSQNDLTRMERILTELVQRDKQIASAGIRRRNGKLHTVIADHDQHWDPSGSASQETHFEVPLYSGDQRWGGLELRFADASSEGLIGLWQNPWAKLLAFLSVAVTVSYSFFLTKALQQLDPSRAVPQRVRAALDALAEGLLVTDGKGRVVLANQAFGAWAGRNVEDLMGQYASRFPWQFPHENATVEDYPWVRALSEKTPQANVVIRLTDCNEQDLTLVANSSPVLGHDGEYRGVLTSFEDVTELEQHKVELIVAKNEADEANHAKSAFLARMSHEIRSPMNAILGYTEVLRRGFDGSVEERDQYLATIHTSGEHLLELINDILDLSKVESGNIDLELAQHSPYEIVKEVIDVQIVRAREKNLSLTFAAETSLPETIETDAVRLRQTLINLIGNAIKFTETGGVDVKIEMTPAGQIAYRVRDTGIGMSAAHLESIFDPFSQADTSITRRFGGTGLGLSISRQLARKMGGDVTVQSELGEGSTFTVTIDPGSLRDVPWIEPARLNQQPVKPVRQVESHTMLPSSRILVVDDSEANRHLARLFLRRAGAAVDTAENGKIAIEKTQATQYDVILMDMHMPVLDGYSATRQLRQLGYTMPIVALTANLLEDDEAKCYEAGCSGFLAKPIKMQQLISKVAELLPPSPAANETQATAVLPESTPEEPTSDRDTEPTPAACPPATANPVDPGEAIRSTIDIDDPEIHEIIAEFVQHLRQRLPEFREALDTDDFKRVAWLAHWLKGAGGTVGFDILSELARDLEASAKKSDQRGARDAFLRIEDVNARIALDAVASA